MAATHKTLFILSYALLEWTLILMLLLDSLFSFLIRKFATYYALKPPCFCCSTIDHMLKPNNDINPFHDLICEAHVTELVNRYYCNNGKCSCCKVNFKENSVDKSTHHASKSKSSYEQNEIQLVGLCIENKISQHIQVFDQIIPLEWTDSSTSCSRCSSLYGDENMVIKDEDQVQKQEGRFLQSSGCKDEEDKVATIDRLMAELNSERLVVCGLYKELDEERNASAIAANQAMAMITRLQEDKIALQIESMQNQRMMDDQAEYDHQVLQLLNERVMKLEKDKFELENELEMYKERFLDNDGKKKAKMKLQCQGASCSITNKSLDDTSVLDLKNSNTHEDYVEEFKAERPWILDKLEELDATLMMLTNDLDVKASLERERLHYKGNAFLGVFGVEGVDEDDEASHSVWPVLENMQKEET